MSRLIRHWTISGIDAWDYEILGITHFQSVRSSNPGPRPSLGISPWGSGRKASFYQKRYYHDGFASPVTHIPWAMFFGIRSHLPGILEGASLPLLLSLLLLSLFLGRTCFGSVSELSVPALGCRAGQALGPRYGGYMIDARSGLSLQDLSSQLPEPWIQVFLRRTFRSQRPAAHWGRGHGFHFRTVQGYLRRGYPCYVRWLIVNNDMLTSLNIKLCSRPPRTGEPKKSGRAGDSGQP